MYVYILEPFFVPKNDIINFTKIKYILKFCVRILNIFIFIMIKNKIKIEKEGIKARKTKWNLLAHYKLTWVASQLRKGL